jgi:hypothetical protein
MKVKGKDICATIMLLIWQIPSIEDISLSRVERLVKNPKDVSI